MNNPQITKTLSKFLLLILNIVNSLLVSIANNELVLKFSVILLNNSNNFFNSFKNYMINIKNLYLIPIITHISITIHKSFYSVLPNNQLHPYYITGFVDGEGCFSINVRPRPNRDKGYAVELVFKITLSSKDKFLLEKIQNFFNVGKLLSQGSSISYCVRSLKDLQVIINHFDNYPLITNKWSDYQLFKQVFEIMEQKEHLNSEGLNKIVSLKAVSNLGWSDKLRELFPDVVPAIRPLVLNQIIPDPNWVSGFVEGEGSFYVKISNKDQVSFRFLITQHVRDAELLKNLINFFECGYYLTRSNSTKHGDFFVTKLDDIICKILPFFEKYPLYGNKLKDFLDFKKAVELKEGITSTNDNLEKIKEIKQGMNQNRISSPPQPQGGENLKYSSIKKSKGFINKRQYSTNTIFSKEKSNKIKFSEWLAGLIDGDGQFNVTKKGISSLKIVMNIKDKSALYEIKHKYGGYIKPISGSNSLKYKLFNPKGLINLIKDINGLIRNPARVLQLNKICLKYNITLLEPKPLSYYNGWLSGIIDSDGSIHIDEKSGQLIISVTQKNKYILEPIQIIYGGKIQILGSKDAFIYYIYRKQEILDLVDNYFQIFPLKSSKKLKINMIKEFYTLSKYRKLNVKYLNEFNQWVQFKDKWEKISRPEALVSISSTEPVSIFSS